MPGPIADWYYSREAKVPMAEQIKSKRFILDVVDRAGGPATTEADDGGDDAHEKAVGGWDTENDALGGVIVDG